MTRVVRGSHVSRNLALQTPVNVSYLQSLVFLGYDYGLFIGVWRLLVIKQRRRVSLIVGCGYGVICHLVPQMSFKNCFLQPTIIVGDFPFYEGPGAIV